MNLSHLTGAEVIAMMAVGDFDHLVHPGLKNWILYRNNQPGTHSLDMTVPTMGIKPTWQGPGEVPNGAARS